MCVVKFMKQITYGLSANASSQTADNNNNHKVHQDSCIHILECICVLFIPMLFMFFISSLKKCVFLEFVLFPTIYYINFYCMYSSNFVVRKYEKNRDKMEANTSLRYR